MGAKKSMQSRRKGLHQWDPRSPWLEEIKECKEPNSQTDSIKSVYQKGNKLFLVHIIKNIHLTGDTTVTHKFAVPIVKFEQPIAAIFDILMANFSHQEGTVIQ